MEQNEIHDELIYEIIGAAMDVHKELKRGLLEAVYHEALCMELSSREIPFLSEIDLPIFYKGKLMQKTYRMDLVCDDIIVELKACENILSEHRAQLFNYLRLTRKPIGILINFGEVSLHFEKYSFDKQTNEIDFYDSLLHK